MVMLSTPPPMMASTPSLTIWWAATVMACRPDEQKRFMVVPATLVGRPASMALVRPMFWPWAPWGWPQPKITSSISAGESWGVLARTSLMQWATRSSGRVRLKEPRKDLPRGVRVLATITASRILRLRGLGEIFFTVKQLAGLKPGAYINRLYRCKLAEMVGKRRPPRKAAATLAGGGFLFTELGEGFSLFG